MKRFLILLLVVGILPAHAGPRRSSLWPRPIAVPRPPAAPRPFTVPRPVNSPYGEHFVEGRMRRDGTYVPGHFRANPDPYKVKPLPGAVKPLPGAVKPYTGFVNPYTVKPTKPPAPSGY